MVGMCLAIGGLRAAFEADHGEHRRHGCATGSPFFVNNALYEA